MSDCHQHTTKGSTSADGLWQNGRKPKDNVEVPKVIIEDSEDSSGFASSVVKVLSMQRFYTKSVRKSRESWLQKYAFHRANEEREWRRPLMRKSPSPSPQPENCFNEQPNATELYHDEEHDSNEDTADYNKECCMPFVVEPSGKTYFCWLVVVSLGVMYNYCAIILYVAFSSLYTLNTKVCFAIDYTFDSIFLLDILVQLRTGFLQHGILERRSKELTINYVTSVGFFLDMLAVIPFDLLYFIVGLYPILRINRLLKVRRFFLCCDRGEIYSGRPKLFNLLKLILYLLLIIHWVACLYFILSRFEGFGKDQWIHPKLEGQWAEVGMQYLYSLHRSSVIMTTVGTITIPRTNLTMIFGCVTYLCGVLIFATIVGNAGDMIVDMRRHREHYLRKLTGMKTYISAHQIPAQITKRVIQWFDYLWTQKRDMDEDQLFAKLNKNFRAEIAIHVNLETLIKVEMFKVCDPGFLHDLVLKLKPMICSPGDFICKEGEKGREMFIVNKGRVEVLDERENILATLKAGSHFGEISLLNMKGIGDRRTASVRSVGFTDLFCLSKDDLEEVLEFYPNEKIHMEGIATKTYEKQQRERLLAKKKLGELNTDEVPKDPREWLAADTATLRRRLSYISSVNNLRRFANKVKKTDCSDGQSARKILKEYSEKARKERTDEECRQIIQDFVAEIRSRSPSHKPSIETDEIFDESPPSPGRIVRWKMDGSSKQKNMKRFSFSLGEEALPMSSPCNLMYRQRSHTLDPLQDTGVDQLNFQSLSNTQRPITNYGSVDVKVKSILKKKSSFGEPKHPVKTESKSFVVAVEPKYNLSKEANTNFSVSSEANEMCTVSKQQNDTLADSKERVGNREPSKPISFKDKVRTTMERRRKWFEGEEINHQNKEESESVLLNPSVVQVSKEEDKVTCSCSSETLDSGATANSCQVWERLYNTKRFKSERPNQPIPLNDAVVITNSNLTEELQPHPHEVLVNYKHTTIPNTLHSKEMIAATAHIECTCSKTPGLSLQQRNDKFSHKDGLQCSARIEETSC